MLNDEPEQGSVWERDGKRRRVVWVNDQGRIGWRYVHAGAESMAQSYGSGTLESWNRWASKATKIEE